MKEPAGHLGEVTRRRRGLVIGVGAPTRDRTTDLDRARMIPAGADCPKPAGGSCGLPNVVQSPADNGLAHDNGAGVCPAGREPGGACNGYDAVRSR